MAELRFAILKNNADAVLKGTREDIRKAIPTVIRKTIRRIRRGTEPRIPVRTGELKRSFFEAVGDTWGVYGTRDFRARFFEFGTRRMKATPMLHPVFQRETVKLPDALAAEIDKGGR